MANTSTTEFVSSLREASRTMRAVSSTLSALCPGGVCRVNNSDSGWERGATAPRTPSLETRLGRSSALPGVITAALSGDMQRSLQGVLRGVIGQLAGGLGSAAGGGWGGSLLASLVGGGLGLLASKLFKGGMFGDGGLAARAPMPLPSLLHFPQLTLPGFASAPASALFGQRATPRNPGMHVTVEYKRGADDFVVAKVAQRLSELNSLEGI